MQTFCIPITGCSFEITQDISWNEADTMLKLEIPTTISGQYLGQGIFGSGELPQDGTDCVSQKWCGRFDAEHAPTICISGTYGSHCVGNTVFLSLFRASAYAAHPIGERKLVHEERFIPRMDQGEHHLRSAGNSDPLLLLFIYPAVHRFYQCGTSLGCAVLLFEFITDGRFRKSCLVNEHFRCKSGDRL